MVAIPVHSGNDDEQAPSAAQGVGSRIQAAFASRGGVVLDLPDRVEAPQPAVFAEGAQRSRTRRP